MKKKVTGLLLLALVIVGAILLYSYFHVSGSEIKGVAEITSDCAVTIRVGYDHYVEYRLDADGVERLKTLLLESSFTRSLAGAVTYPAGTQEYTILIDYQNGQEILMLHSLGNEYLSIADQFGGKHLRIQNPRWEDGLKNIIAQSTIME